MRFVFPSAARCDQAAIPRNERSNAGESILSSPSPRRFFESLTKRNHDSPIFPFVLYRPGGSPLLCARTTATLPPASNRLGVLTPCRPHSATIPLPLDAENQPARRSRAASRFFSLLSRGHSSFSSQSTQACLPFSLVFVALFLFPPHASARIVSFPHVTEPIISVQTGQRARFSSE